MPVPPHAHQDAPPGAHPVIAAAYAAARGQTGADDPSSAALVPASHKAPLRPPSRRAWVAVGLLVALTALPMLVVIFAGRAALRGPDDPRPYRADGGPPVVIEPGPDGAHRPNDAAVAPEASGAVPGAEPSTPVGAVGGGAGGGRTEATPCPTAPGAGAAQAAGGGAGAQAAGGAGAQAAGGAGAQAAGGGAGAQAAGGGAGAQAAGGGAAPAGGGSPGDGSGADAGSGAPGGADGGAAPGGADGAGDSGHGGSGDGSSGDGSSSDHRGDSGDGSPHPPHSGSAESAPGRNFIERVLDELGIPLP